MIAHDRRAIIRIQLHMLTSTLTLHRGSGSGSGSICRAHVWQYVSTSRDGVLLVDFAHPRVREELDTRLKGILHDKLSEIFRRAPPMKYLLRECVGSYISMVSNPTRGRRRENLMITNAENGWLRRLRPWVLASYKVWGIGMEI